MSRLKEIKEEHKATLDIRDLVSTYQEIASIRMRSTRDFVLKNREYYDGVNKIFSLVLNSYRNQLDALSKKGKSLLTKKQASSLFNRNGSKIYVLLSANTYLYGSIVADTFNRFYEDLKTDASAHAAVVGKVGKRLLDDSDYTEKYTYFDLSDSLGDNSHLNDILKCILSYETVVVYHGSFKTILSQLPEASFLTGGSESVQKTNKNIQFNFEPDFNTVLAFFEDQIIASNFEQSVNESYLSKYASRMISLDHSLGEIDKHVKKLNLRKQKVKHYVTNKKQQDTIAGLHLWN